MPAGRPSSYTPDIADAICEGIASGLSVRKVCEAKGLPEPTTVFRWLASTPLFREQYMRAREARADARFEQVDEIMRKLEGGEIDHNQARVMLDGVKWQTGKESPKRYGDRVELAGDPNAPLLPHIVVEFIDSPKEKTE